jgi:hypothetical protein
MLKVTKRRCIVLLGVIAAVVVAGAAIAYWTAGGSGDGTAATANPTDQLVVQQTGTLTAMFPGDSPQTLSGNFDNPTGNLVRVNKVTASIASVTPVGAGTCDATDYILSSPAMTVNAEIPDGTGQGNWTGATIQFRDKAGVNQDGCKGATVNLHYVVS